MKFLYYNELEVPSKTRFVSSILSLDKTFEEGEAGNSWIDESFELSKSDLFDDILVYLTNHNGAYTKPNKNSTKREKVTGWISLKSVRKGGGYLNDHAPWIE